MTPRDRARAGSRWRLKAEAWMEEHPEAMRLLESLALQSAGAGRPFGIGALTERVRWFFKVEKGDEAFKINNNYRAYIARELVRRHPDLEGLIEFRSTTDEAELEEVPR